MSSAEKLALWLGGGLAALLFLAALAGPRSHNNGVDVSLHGSVDLGDDLDRPWLCQPSDIDKPVSWAHPLYRRPHTSRPHHEQLAKTGWGQWYLDPPSEATEN